MFNFKKLLPIAAIAAFGLSLGACSHGPRGYANAATISDDEPEVEGSVGNAYAMQYRGSRAGCQHGRPVTTPGGRTACVEHITDRSFTHQPEFKRPTSDKEKYCGGRTGQIVKINLGEGLVGNYRC